MKKAIKYMYDHLKDVRGVELKRLDKAVSLAESGTTGDPAYRTEFDHCYCPDAMVRRSVICKHRLAYMLLHPDQTLPWIFENG